MIAQNSSTATPRVQQQSPVARSTKHPITGTLAAALTAWLTAAALAIAPTLAQQPSAAGPVTHDKSADSIKVVIPPAKHKPNIIAKSDTGVTIHFDDCRENDKQHVSCSFEDADGKQHWVYLPGLPLPGSK